jgi:DNA-binding winged helix-turn-helix (wHTH) protein
MADPAHTLHFGPFELDCANRHLRRDGTPVELGSRYFDALALLVTRQGALVSKDAFMREVWHGIPVTDEALTQCIRTLRRALEDDAAAPRFIQTVPKHGYRFIAPARSDAPIGTAPPETTASVSMVAGTCTLAGLAAGAIAGLVYGIIVGTGGGGQVLILTAMIGALGLLAGAGLGAGMAAALAWRGPWWTIPGAAIGGLCVGALGNLLGREGVGLLSGISIGAVTGPFEGLILGTATGVCAATVFIGATRRSAMGVALVAGTLAGALIAVSGGSLLAGSLRALEEGLPGARLDVARIGALLGDAGLTPAALRITTIAESLVFVAGIGAGLLALRSRHPEFGPVGDG